MENHLKCRSVHWGNRGSRLGSLHSSGLDRVALVKQGTINNTKLPGEGHSEHLKCVKTVWRPELRPGLRWGSLQSSPDSPAGGEGLAGPSQEPLPRSLPCCSRTSALWDEVSFASVEKILATALHLQKLRVRIKMRKTRHKEILQW